MDYLLIKLRVGVTKWLIKMAIKLCIQGFCYDHLQEALKHEHADHFEYNQLAIDLFKIFFKVAFAIWLLLPLYFLLF